jgi:hypothetical protein
MDWRDMGEVLEAAKTSTANAGSAADARARQLDPDGHDKHLADALTKIGHYPYPAPNVSLAISDF